MAVNDWLVWVFGFIGWIVAGVFWYSIFTSGKEKEKEVFGDLVRDGEEIYLHCPHCPEELLKHKYVTLKVIDISRK